MQATVHQGRTARWTCCDLAGPRSGGWPRRARAIGLAARAQRSALQEQHRTQLPPDRANGVRHETVRVRAAQARRDARRAHGRSRRRAGRVPARPRPHRPPVRADRDRSGTARERQAHVHLPPGHQQGRVGRGGMGCGSGCRTWACAGRCGARSSTRTGGLLFADDVVLLAESADELQAAMDIVSEHARRWRYTFNNKKSAVVVAGGRARALSVASGG